MKNLGLFFMILLPFFCFGQVNESFLDGNFINNPNWTGTTSNFFVNNAAQLQSQAAATSTSFLFTPSQSIENAVWECWIKINYSTSASNYAAIYLVSDQSDVTAGCNGYYVQVGGTNDEVSLFVQEGTKKTKIIDGADKRTDGNPVELRVKVTRDAEGNFALYTKLANETNFVLEGTTQNKAVVTSSYFGLLFSNTSTTGSAYYFDDIVVTGDKTIDKLAPEWISLTLEQPDKLILLFSEPMDFSKSAFSIDQGIGSPSSQSISADKKSVILHFNSKFERGRIYNLQVSGLSDLAGNSFSDTARSFGVLESKEAGDLVINEIMFENPVNSLEYIEIYNRSDKVLDVSGMVLSTRKTDGSLNTGIKFLSKTYLLPDTYLALSENADSVRNYHNPGVTNNIVSTEWMSLNNETATVVLTNAAKDTVYDEVTYSVKWHHALVKNPKGVALERINPALPSQDASSWHSAAWEVSYGTPGYKNSQYRDLDEASRSDKIVWLEPEAFSPDNDGVDDICVIRYKTESNGFVGNALILNAVGEKVFQLAANQLLQVEGFLTWDGKTDKGRNANTGIYILYFEMFNPQTGVRKQSKLPVVVSSR